MALMRYNPFWEMDTITKEMDKLMQSFQGEGERKEMPRRDFYPPVDIMEDNETIHFEFELPGVDKSEVKISINDDNVLTIKGSKKFPKEEAKTCCRNERSYGNFFRTFQLPEEIDTENVDANFENGILHVAVKRTEPVKPEEKEIEVK